MGEPAPQPGTDAASSAPASDVTRLLREARTGDSTALGESLLPLLYEELRRLARSKLHQTPGGTSGQTLQPTALVHEAYMRLVHRDALACQNRAHFFFVAARAMQDILVEQARARASLKRGGDRRRVSVDDSELMIEAPAEDLGAIADALHVLESSDARKAQVVRMKYFAGLTTDQIADVLGVSVATVEREWRFARALLFHQLGEGDPGGQAG